MLIKFLAKTMPAYAGVDGTGNQIKLTKGETAEVSETVAKLLMQKYGGNFELVFEQKPEHAPKLDKLYRKLPKTKIK